MMRILRRRLFSLLGASGKFVKGAKKENKKFIRDRIRQLGADYASRQASLGQGSLHTYGSGWNLGKVVQESKVPLNQYEVLSRHNNWANGLAEANKMDYGHHGSVLGEVMGIKKTTQGLSGRRLSRAIAQNKAAMEMHRDTMGLTMKEAYRVPSKLQISTRNIGNTPVIPKGNIVEFRPSPNPKRPAPAMAAVAFSEGTRKNYV